MTQWASSESEPALEPYKGGEHLQGGGGRGGRCGHGGGNEHRGWITIDEDTIKLKITYNLIHTL